MFFLAVGFVPNDTSTYEVKQQEHGAIPLYVFLYLRMDLQYFPLTSSLVQVPITTKIFLGLLESLKNTYGNIPIYIHENGMAIFLFMT